ncbi:MAG TPA: helix-turn-helix domain-containing protein [Isosphaeraceae bacterium]|nr:helix-turn-helix domain-containing protein [Isosphaeraceae bacterium]
MLRLVADGQSSDSREPVVSSDETSPDAIRAHRSASRSQCACNAASVSRRNRCNEFMAAAILERDTTSGIGGCLMRGREPLPLTITPADALVLKEVARSGSLPWYQVRSARIVLAIAAGERRQTVAAHMQCDETTVWRTCRRYERSSLQGLLADRRKGHSGRHERISPPPAGTGRRTGLLGAGRQGPAHHPLVP